MTNALMLGLWIQALIATPQTAELPEQPLGKVLICSTAEHGEQTQTCKPYQPPTAIHQQNLPARQEGRLAFIDPVSLERLEPSREQLEELNSLHTIDDRFGAGTEPVDVEYLADGTVRMRLNERFLVYRTVSIRQPNTPRSRDEACK